MKFFNFHSEDIDFLLSNQDTLSSWLQTVVEEEKKEVEEINFIFCSDTYLHKINVDYLQHDTYTDIITFPYQDNLIRGDIFISIDRVKENASIYKQSFEKELNRVMVHGVLHLLGYLDKTPAQKSQMTQKEDYYLTNLDI